MSKNHKFLRTKKLFTGNNPTIQCSFCFCRVACKASRQIRRRVPYAGHLMTPRRLWLNKIPTLCDVVIEFPGKKTLFFIDFRTRFTRIFFSVF